jgi:ribosomal protein S18 acetylase RimI-like enzyme
VAARYTTGTTAEGEARVDRDDAEGGADRLELRPLAAGDEETVAALLARAFRDNPLNVAVIGPDAARRLRCNLQGMRALLPVARHQGWVRTVGRGAVLLGAIVATPPFAYPLPPPLPHARLRLLLGQGWRVGWRWRSVFEQLDALHPREPHWYLGTVGVDPAAQGRGAGRALLAAFLRGADADRLPAYLETDRAGNLPFYERAGFVVVGETQVLGVRIWRMRRPSQPV